MGLNVTSKLSMHFTWLYICCVLVLPIGYLVCISLRVDLANHHTSSTLDAETSSLVFKSNQVFWPLAYTRHGYAGSISVKSCVLKARIPPLGLGNPASDTFRF